MDDKTKYVVSIDKHLARIDWHQTPTLADITEVLQSIIASPQYHKDLRLLAVDHGAAGDTSGSDVKEAVKALAPLVRKFKSSALVEKVDINYTVALLFNAHLYLNEKIRQETFRDEAAAAAWLLSQ